MAFIAKSSGSTRKRTMPHVRAHVVCGAVGVSISFSVYVDYQNASTMQALFRIVLFVTIIKASIIVRDAHNPLRRRHGLFASSPTGHRVASSHQFLCDSHNYFGCRIVIILCLVAVEARSHRTGLRQHYFDLGIYSYFDLVIYSHARIYSYSKQTQNAFICAFGV